ncbi:mitochondrial K+-H+ exchange-related-domain-containing protein [Scheffersomyces coipomensis]|uniref:mitochondrial K+-H+ exchange-related-domain-containing protein n=1 Tax=Scheffersomyces coipomensis TaxID=1788519 RepID=UPI00315CDC59
MKRLTSIHHNGSLILSSRITDFAPTYSIPLYRYQSTSTSRNPTAIINHDSIWVISIPITSSRSYIYCNHKPTILDGSQLQRFPLVTKLETRLIGIASKGWQKLASSKFWVNKRIYEFANQVLKRVPYQENCLKSFPSKRAMIREINEESLEEVNRKLNNDSGNHHPNIIQTDVDEFKIPLDQLKSIPLYHPSFQNPSIILNQLYNFRDKEKSKHRKYAILCAIGIPISLPFALIPVVPNIPGFYLAYRLYCHVKALTGVNHLDYLLEGSETALIGEEDEGDTGELLADPKTVADTRHISFKSISQIDKYYDNPTMINSNSISEDEEKVIINEDIITRLCNDLELDHLKEDLLRALSQESTRLKQNLKVNDTVE